MKLFLVVVVNTDTLNIQCQGSGFSSEQGNLKYEFSIHAICSKLTHNKQQFSILFCDLLFVIIAKHPTNNTPCKFIVSYTVDRKPGNNIRKFCHQDQYLDQQHQI